ncbi:hypothetical protein DFH08DRAFT_805371 [Mycena albidolilacea]|uniref:Uncharacterized protein n=1 Tax=Mycena albidolilacea TaxID=1033008 RepID=A0AAD7A8E0_9AGAR|nr:hypothetical protein DFH08DRAFT_805371 [Mycena albidolilacea]
MRFVLLVAIASVFAPTLGRKSRLVTRGLDDAAPLPTAAAISGGQITNGLGRLTQCPISTTACARHRTHADDGGARATATLDCIDTDVDFRSSDGRQAGGAYFRTKGRIKERIARRLMAPQMRLVIVLEDLTKRGGDFWKHNPHTKKWEGNPVFDSGFGTYYESLKNRRNRTGTATQALPMLPTDLMIIMEYLDSAEAVKYFTETQRLYFKVFVTTAFTLWTRPRLISLVYIGNDELFNLQFKDIKFDLRSRTEIPYHEFSLIFRKTNKDPTKVQKYMVQTEGAMAAVFGNDRNSIEAKAWTTYWSALSAAGEAIDQNDAYTVPVVVDAAKKPVKNTKTKWVEEDAEWDTEAW